MKRARKMLAILVAMAMTLGMTATAFASGEQPPITGKASDRGTIRVHEIENGVKTVTAYKIVKAEYNGEGGSFSNYVSLYPDVISVNNDGKTNTEFTEDALSSIYKSIQANKTTGITMIGETSTTEGKTTYKAENVEPGSYLIVVEGGNSIYNPMVSSLYYGEENGKNTLVAEDANAKSTNSPVVSKNVVSDDGTEIKGNTLSVGDSVSYKVEINPIPYYGGNNPKLEVVDTLSDGLDYQDDIDVYVIKAGGSELEELSEDAYVVDTSTKGIIKVNFVKDGKYTLNQYKGDRVVITYSAKLNSSAVYNGNPNTNSVKLDYTKNSNVSGNDGSSSANTYTYTFDITGSMNGILTKGFITKTGSDVETETKALEGAEFALYTDEACTNKYKNGVMTTETIRSNENGFLAIKGLAAGNYWLKEIKAPEGYSLNERIIPIVITADFESDGKLKSFTVTVDGNKGGTFTITNGKAIPDNVTTVEINNTKLSSLPSTGGIGTTIFTIGGCIIMIVAAGLFFASRRKTAK